MTFSTKLIFTLLTLNLTFGSPIFQTRLQTTPFNLSLVSIRSTDSDDPFFAVRSSPITLRVTAAGAAFPIFLSMVAHVFLSTGHHRKNWSLSFLATCLLIASKFVAIPLGLALLLAGLVIADLEVSLVGVSSLAFVYAAQVGTWDGASRLVVFLLWAPNMLSMQRWHIDGRAEAVIFDDDNPDSYNRGRQAFRRLIAYADENSNTAIGWLDELIIALLATKFASLTQKELDWKECNDRPSVVELLTKLARWDKGWKGQPGIWLRKWTSFQPMELIGPPPGQQSTVQVLVRPSSGPVTEALPSQTNVQTIQVSDLYEETLRFVIVIFECIRRSSIKTKKEQRRELLRVLEVSRGDGDMGWFHDLIRRCVDDNAANRALGPSHSP